MTKLLSYTEVDIQDKEAMHESVWVNDTDKVISLRIMDDRRTGRKQSGVHFKNIKLKPGEKIRLSAEYDKAIRTVNKEGVIIGGLCPWLKKEEELSDDSAPELPRTFEYKKDIEALELNDLAARIRREKDMREAIDFKDSQEKAPKKTK